MKVSPIVRYGLFSVAAVSACLAIAYGFDAVAEANIQEAIFRSGRYYNAAVDCVHCRGTRAELAGNKAGWPLE